MKMSKKTHDKLEIAFSKGPKLLDPDDDRLPVGIPYVDRVAIRGSVHLSTGRIISRKEINKRFDKAFSK
jgi:hypothetical protein